VDFGYIKRMGIHVSTIEEHPETLYLEGVIIDKPKPMLNR
jgi:hypothetical protein